MESNIRPSTSGETAKEEMYRDRKRGPSFIGEKYYEEILFQGTFFLVDFLSKHKRVAIV